MWRKPVHSTPQCSRWNDRVNRNLHLLPGSNNIPQNMEGQLIYRTDTQKDLPQLLFIGLPTFEGVGWTKLRYASWTSCWFFEGYAKKGGLFLACGMEAGSCMYKWGVGVWGCLISIMPGSQWISTDSDHNIHDYTKLFSVMENAKENKSGALNSSQCVRPRYSG